MTPEFDFPMKPIPATQRYHDRREAARILGERVKAQCGLADGTVVVALPRGGVPIGAGVAAALHAPLDVMVVRKLGLPRYEELAMGAIAAGGFEILDQVTIGELGISPEVVEAVMKEEREELHRR